MVCLRCKLLVLLVIQMLIVIRKIRCNNHFEVVAKYVSSLVEIETLNDPTRKHDVALIRVEADDQFGLFDAISTEILKSNPQNSVFIHATQERIVENRIHAASVFVIATDIADHVRIKIQIFVMILNLELPTVSTKEAFEEDFFLQLVGFLREIYFRYG